jgi:Xaa-Pro aminopeptidase
LGFKKSKRGEKMSIIKEKVEQSAELLKEFGFDMWITFARETSVTPDPTLNYIFEDNLTWKSAIIITKDGDKTAIVGSLDANSIERRGIYKVIPYVKSFSEPFIKYLKDKNPSSILLNFSKDSPVADGLSYGMFLNIFEILKNEGYGEKIISSEKLIASLIGRKTESEIKAVKNAIDETLKIFSETTNFIKEGVSEKQIADFVKSKVKERGFGYAWEEEMCPAVFAGPQTGGAHSGPTDKILKKGEVVNMDFGISLNGYVSDLQRTWYLLKDNETEAPEPVKKGFKVLIESVEKAAKGMRAGVKGIDIDTIARNHIIENGYPEYPHALGHQVGRSAHDGTALLAPAWERYGNLPYIELEENMLFTIEPRIPIEGYGVVTVEDIVIVQKDGVKFLSNPQKELILIK